MLGNDNIVFSEQKREQQILDMPLAVNAVVSAEVEKLGAFDIDQIQTTVPNITLDSPEGSRHSAILGNIAPPAARLPTTCRYVNVVALKNGALEYGLVFPLVDRERIEVLRGPQLTLYRESSTGGSMKFITKNATPGHTDFFFREAVDHTAGILQGE